jgi:hypothetical protein
MVRSALERGERILFLIPQDAHAAIPRQLREPGVAADRCVARRQLVIEAADPARAVDALTKHLAEAVREEYPTLRVIAEIAGARAVEASLDRWIAHKQCVLACVYEPARRDPVEAYESLWTHPLVVVGADLLTNPMHVEPGEGGSASLIAPAFRRALETIVRLHRAQVIAQAPAAARPAEPVQAVRSADLVTAGDVLHLLARFECRSQEQYMRLAHAMVLANPALADLFRELARREEFHARRMEDACRQHAGGDPPPEDFLQSVLRAKAPYTCAEVERIVDDGRKALALALKMENESAALYEWALARGLPPAAAEEARAVLDLKRAQVGDLRAKGGTTVILRRRSPTGE